MTAILKASKDVLDPSKWPNLLITTDDWFTGPDGIDYKRVFGPVDVITAKALLGFEPKSSTNWFAAVGPPGRQVLIFGCRIHYVVMCPERPRNMVGILDLSGRA